MRALIVNPLDDRIRLGNTAWTPLGAASAAAELEASGWKVKIFDRQAERQRAAATTLDLRMEAEAAQFRPDLILLDSLPWCIYDTTLAARRLRRAHPCPIGVFGAAAALPAEAFKKIPEVDFLIEGEVEGPLRRLAESGWQDAAGIWVRKGAGGQPPGQPAVQVHPDTLPFPAFHLLDMPYYTKRSLHTIWGHYLSSVTLMTSRGCNGRCSFCLESRIFGQGLRLRSLERVLEDMERVLSGYPVDAIYFKDPNFAADPERCLEFCRRVRRRGLHRRVAWSAQVRADALSEDLLRWMKRAGCTLLELGVETPSQTHLNALTKGSSAQAAAKAVALCRKVGIHSHAYLMTGFEGETVEDLEASLAWVRRHRPSYFFWNRLMVFPGTPLYGRLGDCFFEKASWDDREAVRQYFRRDFSRVSGDRRRQWYEHRTRPFTVRRQRLCILKANPPWRVAELMIKKTMRKLTGGPLAAIEGEQHA